MHTNNKTKHAHNICKKKPTLSYLNLSMKFKTKLKYESNYNTAVAPA